jgi:hypothetical protein
MTLISIRGNAYEYATHVRILRRRIDHRLSLSCGRLRQGISVALWGGRHPDQVESALGVAGWSLTDAERELIEHIVNTAVVDPIGPEFMAPPQRP